jgi:hypothetical protein
MYDHRFWKTRDPVRSPIDKPVTARPVLGWETTRESLVLYIFRSFFGHHTRVSSSTEKCLLAAKAPTQSEPHSISIIGYGVAVTSMTLTHQPGVRLPVSET